MNTQHNNNELNITIALGLLNQATGRDYGARQDGDSYTLTMPGGGSYPSRDGQATRELMMRLTLAAQGR